MELVTEGRRWETRRWVAEQPERGEIPIFTVECCDYPQQNACPFPFPLLMSALRRCVALLCSACSFAGSLLRAERHRTEERRPSKRTGRNVRTHNGRRRKRKKRPFKSCCSLPPRLSSLLYWSPDVSHHFRLLLLRIAYRPLKKEEEKQR